MTSQPLHEVSSTMLTPQIDMEFCSDLRIFSLHCAMAPLDLLSAEDDAAVNVMALRSSSAAVRLAAMKALRESTCDLSPFTDQILVLVADDSDPEDSNLEGFRDGIPATVVVGW